MSSNEGRKALRLQRSDIHSQDADQDSDDVEGFEGSWYAFPPIRNALIAGALLVTGWFVSQFQVLVYIPVGIFGLAILIGAYYWAREGLEEFVEEREIGIEALMAFATLGAVVLGQWFEAAFLVFLYAGAESIEEYTFARTRTAIRALLDLVPETAALLTDAGEVQISAKELEAGNLFLVRPGERIPTDGEIFEGASSIDEAAVTGESVPVEKAVGDKVFAGTINTTGILKVRATTSFASNSLQKIIQTVEKAQGVKSSAQRWIDRFGRRYSPAVLVVALLLIVIPYLTKTNFALWSIRAVVLLVAAAPCALVISTPVAISAAIGRSGREGVLIKGGIHLENLAKIRVVAFDKTGTLTRGKPVVTNVFSTTNETASLLRHAASIEHLSEHPLAKAIVENAQAEGIAIAPVQNFQSLTGAGAKADIDGQTIYIGSPGLFRQLRVPLERLESEIERLQAEGKTVVLVGTQDRIEGLFAIRDEPRSAAKRAIQQLHKMQVKVAMLTGDNARTAKAIATELGIDEVRADLKPDDKVKAIQELEQQYGPVAMTGDGINDAPALATATVGLAMGTAGTDAAIEAADIALMGDDPSRVAYALKLAKASQRISFQNIVFSILVLVILIPGAILGLLGITAAVFAHEASELLAIANGLRITRQRL
jgi:heavy metal translocating P-type ATPase